MNQAQKQFEIHLGGYHVPPPLVSHFSLLERLNEFMPTLHLGFWFNGHSLEGEAISRGMKLTIVYLQDDPSEHDDGKMVRDTLEYEVQDFKVEYAPRTGKSHVSLFCTPSKIDRGFYTGVRGCSAFKEPCASVIQRVLKDAVGECQSDTSSEDEMLWISNLETNSQLAYRMLSYSWMGGRDFVSAFIDRHAKARVGSFLGFLGDRSSTWKLDSISKLIEQETAPLPTNTLEGSLEKGNQEVSYPITGFEVTGEFGTSSMSGLTGLVNRSWDFSRNAYTFDTVYLDKFAPDGSGTFFPAFDWELGYFGAVSLGFEDSDAEVFKGYQYSQKANEVFWNHVNGNSVEFAMIYQPKMSLGQTFTIISDVIDDDDNPRKGLYLDGMRFIVSEIETKMEGREDFGQATDTRLWMRVKGIAFGTDIGMNSGTGGLVEIGK